MANREYGKVVELFWFMPAKQQKMSDTTMYHDKSILGLILGTIVTLFGSIIMSITSTVNAVFIFGITRADVSFAVTLIAGISTTIAALIKARRDFKEGKLRVPFSKKRKR